MQINSTTGLLEEVTYIPSINHDSRPANTEISLLVIHCISLPPGNLSSAEVIKLFTNQLNFDSHEYYQQIRGLKVSSHCYIERNGEIIQFVPFYLRAWHAGDSVFNGVSCCNDYSIGIELAGTEDTMYTDEQYLSLNKLIRVIQQEYPLITNQRIVGHSDIAPGRKSDPGECFDWHKVIS